MVRMKQSVSMMLNRNKLTMNRERESWMSSLHSGDRRKSRLPTGIPWKYLSVILPGALCICHPGRKQLQQAASVRLPFPWEETSCHKRCPGCAKRQRHERLTPTIQRERERDVRFNVMKSWTYCRWEASQDLNITRPVGHHGLWW